MDSAQFNRSLFHDTVPGGRRARSLLAYIESLIEPIKAGAIWLAVTMLFQRDCRQFTVQDTGLKSC